MQPLANEKRDPMNPQPLFHPAAKLLPDEPLLKTELSIQSVAVPMQRLVRAGALLLWALLLSAEQPLEIRGTVTRVSEGEVALRVEGQLFPREGDSVQILTEVPGLGETPLAGAWKVTSVTQTGVLIERTEGEGVPKTGSAVRITSTNPQRKSDAPRTLNAAPTRKDSGRTASTATPPKPSTSPSGPAPKGEAVDIRGLLRDAAMAFARCDFELANGYLDRATGLSPADTRISSLRDLVDRQLEAVSVYRKALAAGSAELLREAVRVAGPAEQVPPCQLAPMQRLADRLEMGEVADRALEERERDLSKRDALYEDIAAAAIGALGEFSRSQRGPLQPSAGDNLGARERQSRFGAAGSSRECSVDVSRSSGSDYFVAAFQQRSLWRYVVIALSESAREQALAAIREDPRSRGTLGPFSTQEQAVAAARQRCPSDGK